MREIKFRAYDTLKKVMISEGFHVIGEVTMFGEIDNYCLNNHEGKTTLERYGDIKIMQYTCLKDKNGKEIYEGDIGEIKTQSGRIDRFVVKWGIHRREMASGWEVDIPGFCFWIDNFPSFPIVNNYNNGHDLDIISIIGNIYENPDLIP